MMRNLFQLYSTNAQSKEQNSGAKVIQFSEHKHKSENKKHKPVSTRTHGDSLARNIKSHHSFKSHHQSGHRTVVKPSKKGNSKFFQASTLFYCLAVMGILFGLFMLLGGFSLIFK